MISSDTILKRTPDVVTRRIGDETIIVPVVAGVGHADDDLYTLRGTGQDLWERLDGTASLAGIAAALGEDYEVSAQEALQDVTGFCSELLKRKLLVHAV